MKKLCVYTCITGDYDNLKELEIIEDGIDYYCFTNNKKIKSNTWKVVYIEDKKLSNVLLARKTKLLGHPMINSKYDVLFWIDGDLRIRKPIKSFMDEYCDLDKYDFISFKHHARDNIFQEIKACLYFGRETREKALKLKEFYKKEKYKYDNVLIESTIMIKKNIDIVNETMKMWFDMLLNYSHRDQLSFNYVISKTNLNVNLIDLNVWNNEFFQFIRHNKSNDEKYRISFENKKLLKKDNDVERSIDDDFNGILYEKYKIDGDKYSMDFVVPFDTKKIEIEIIDSPNKIINNINTTKSKCSFKIEPLNLRKCGNFYISTSEKGKLLLTGNIKKDSRIVIDFNIEKSGDLYELIHDYETEKNKILAEKKKIEEEYYELQVAYYKIINSRGWKLLEKGRKIIKRRGSDTK